MRTTTHDDYAVHGWFSLSYSQYLTVPRSILEAMRGEWQARFVELMNELDETFDWRPETGNYWVQLKDGEGKYVRDPFMQYRHPNREAIEKARRK